MTITTEQIAYVLELDSKRTQGEWKVNDQQHSGWMDNAVYITARAGNLARVYADFSEQLPNAAFIAAAPLMAQIIRHQQDQLRAANEALQNISRYDPTTNYQGEMAKQALSLIGGQ